jgi:DNA-binding Lrp family transcriptional regulator
VVKTYVLIVTNPGRTRHVATALALLPHIETVSEVMGPYDIVVEIMTDSLTDIPAILSDEIRTLDGIESTTSLVAFPGDGAP